MAFSIRRLSSSDSVLLKQVGRATYEPFYHRVWNPGGLDWYMEKCFGEGTLESEFADPNIEYWLAETEAGETVGFLKLILQKPVPNGATDALYLEKIYLMPAFYGKGAGQHLISFAKGRALELGREAVWLAVMKSGPVWAYERAGFQVIGETSWDFPLLKEEEREGWVMLCTL